uniref:Fumarylacetoacetate hydrolase n=1 Tax=Rhizophora mucronata TaxID=61149 RepID=A0A2P2LII4_RHIMU
MVCKLLSQGPISVTQIKQIYYIIIYTSSKLKQKYNKKPKYECSLVFMETHYKNRTIISCVLVGSLKSHYQQADLMIDDTT